MSTRYVRSKYSEDAPRWALHDVTGYNSDPSKDDWCVHRAGLGTLFLPKSEYLEVPAPEVWEDVTKDCYIEDDGRGDCQVMHERMSRFIRSKWGEDYRLRKVHLSNWHNEERTFKSEWAFIVKRRKEQP